MGKRCRRDCTEFNDCCEDFVQECLDTGAMVDSCVGHCFSNAGLCFCDSACTLNGRV